MGIKVLSRSGQRFIWIKTNDLHFFFAAEPCLLFHITRRCEYFLRIIWCL